MSGGSLNYFYSQLEDHVGDFEDKELDELVKDLAELFHDREWYLSADTGIGSWREARDAFKDKWFSEHGRQERIERYLEEITDEVREMFGITFAEAMEEKRMKIGDEVFVHGYVDEIRKDAVIIRNNGGYFGTTEDEVTERTGRWTHVYDENAKLFFRNKWVCSACGKSNTYGMSDFCPCCGAMMENSTRRTKEAEDKSV